MRLMMSRSGIRNVLVACALSAGLLTNVTPASSSVAHDDGWLRLAHLSPNTPAVDVYLYDFGNPKAEVVLHHVSYGTVSPFLPAPAGTYTVAMRAAGAAATSAPVLSTAVHVQAGDAYTVAGMGPKDGLRLVVLKDDLSAPAGHSMVQVIQASMREHLVTVQAKAHVLGHDLAFATATAFQSLPAGSYVLHAAGQTESAENRIDLQSGSIHTLVILDAPGRLKIVNLTDAVGSTVLPPTAPATGFGGTAPIPGPSLLPWLSVVAAGLLLIAIGLVSLRRNRRQFAARRV
ncbi:MAG TPA: DUF4397 domain-containing protein [Streptosporangiaceae bacterium]|jgi:hypothetical protein|nr:DUF4397 domain-containing protein [Streptosporangiaceae bacterium]